MTDRDIKELAVMLDDFHVELLQQYAKRATLDSKAVEAEFIALLDRVGEFAEAQPNKSAVVLAALAYAVSHQIRYIFDGT